MSPMHRCLSSSPLPAPRSMGGSAHRRQVRAARTHASDAARSFTLVELLVVIAVLMPCFSPPCRRLGRRLAARHARATFGTSPLATARFEGSQRRLPIGFVSPWDRNGDGVDSQAEAPETWRWDFSNDVGGSGVSAHTPTGKNWDGTPKTIMLVEDAAAIDGILAAGGPVRNGLGVEPTRDAPRFNSDHGDVVMFTSVDGASGRPIHVIDVVYGDASLTRQRSESAVMKSVRPSSPKAQLAVA